MGIEPPTAATRFGLRALVTRPRAEAAGLAAALAERGVEAIVEPLLDINYRDMPAPNLSGVQAILCTSANGVRALARFSPERERPLFAVGNSTTARARAEGFVRVESAGGNVADLARLARERLRPDEGRLLHVAGTDIAGDLAGVLRADGFEVERAVLY
jgi:uroporphyrinogen-III synthase